MPPPPPVKPLSLFPSKPLSQVIKPLEEPFKQPNISPPLKPLPQQSTLIPSAEITAARNKATLDE